MFPYPKSVTPAVQTHLNAQTAFLNDVSKSFFTSIQNLSKLNFQLTQTLLEESTNAAQQFLTADNHTDLISAAASRAQPAAEKLRAYQQHLSSLAADSQVELARVTETHVQETSRTAKALAEEVVRTASEETERSAQKQQETIRKFTDPFAQHGSTSNDRGGASLQSAKEGNVQGGAQGNRSK